VRGTASSQALATSFTLVPGRAPKSSPTTNTSRVPAQGVVLGVTVAPSPARSGQIVVTTITTAAGAAVHADIYAGSHRLVHQAGHADKHGTFRFRVAARTLAPKRGKATVLVKVVAQSGGHTATRQEALVVTP
jgi:hypothetical protein